MSSIRSNMQIARLRRACLPGLILAAFTGFAHAAPSPSPMPADDVSFDADFFPTGTAPKVDLSRFSRGDGALAGTYRGDIMVNRTWQARTDIVLKDVDGQDSAQPCYSARLLREIGVDLTRLADDNGAAPTKALPAGTFCDALGNYIPGATAHFDMGEQVLALEIPQVYTARAARGYVDPAQWDEGINAFVATYNANVYRNEGHGAATTSGYVGLNSSMNLGAWHLRHLGALTASNAEGARYSANSTYIEHDIPMLRAQMVLGDTYTPGAFFDSMRMRGMRMFTDDRMLPQSMRGFAPTVRGIAETNARVVIRQRGYIVSDTTVAPGPFVIDDLFPTGYGGDLDVEVVEADGRVRRFVVPFSAVPQLLRPGQQRWELASGRMQEQNLRAQPFFLQGTLQRGLTNRVTGYGGGVVANGYRAFLGGIGVNTAIGAFSLDATHARNQAPGQSASQGLSLRAGYNKNFLDTGTNFALAAYRYSSSGYVGLSDAVLLRDIAARGENGSNLPRERSRVSVNINQELGDRWGQLYVNAAVREFRNGAQRQVDFSAGYNNRYKDLSYSFSAQRSLDSGVRSLADRDRIPGQRDDDRLLRNARRDTRLMLTFTLPLGHAEHSPQLVAMADQDGEGKRASRASVTGMLGEDNRYSYNATAGHANGTNTLDVSGNHIGSQVNLNAGYSRGTGYQQFSGSASGSVLVHAGGVTLSPPVGETVGLVQATDAAGARVENGQGSTVDGRGFAIVPNLQPYELNVVTLDPKGTSVGVELKATTQRVAPRAGAVVRLRYDTVSGRALIIDTTLPDGRPVPFGADIFDAEGQSVGVAGQASRLMVRDMPASGALTVKWGEAASERCTVQVELPPTTKKHQAALETYKAACVISPAQAIANYPGVYGTPSSLHRPGKTP